MAILQICRVDRSHRFFEENFGKKGAIDLRVCTVPSFVVTGFIGSLELLGFIFDEFTLLKFAKVEEIIVKVFPRDKTKQ